VVYLPQATLYWVLLLVYVGPLGIHFTGYCWFMLRLEQHFTGYCFWFMRGRGQHTLLGIAMGYVKFPTHITGYLHHVWYEPPSSMDSKYQQNKSDGLRISETAEANIP
jgi:hypothetical protein